MTFSFEVVDYMLINNYLGYGHTTLILIRRCIMKNQSKDSHSTLGDDRFNTAGYTSDEENVSQAKEEVPASVSNKRSSETSRP